MQVKIMTTTFSKVVIIINTYEDDEVDLNDLYDYEEDWICEHCGGKLKVGYEETEAWGFVERRKILYCPKCN